VRARLPRAEREQQMLSSAHALFAERGYADVTMDDVAAAVGITKPLLYNYFGNKERLYLACMRPAGDALMAAVVDAVAADRNAWRVLYDDSLPASGQLARRMSEYRDRVTGLVTAALRERSDEPEVEPLAVALLGAAEALGRWWLRTESMPAAAAAELLIRTVEPGLTRNPRTP
jgi:AcrR family transcriptional regulator